MTGSPVPAGADAVLPAESATEDGGLLKVVEPVAPGKNVGRTGEDVPAGRTVLHGGPGAPAARPGAAVVRRRRPGRRGPPAAGRDPGDRRRTPAARARRRHGLPDRRQQLGRAAAPWCRRDGGEAAADAAPARPGGRDPRGDGRRRLGRAARLRRHVGRAARTTPRGWWPSLGELPVHGSPCGRRARPGSASSAAGRCSCCRATRCRACAPTTCSPAGPCAGSAGRSDELPYRDGRVSASPIRSSRPSGGSITCGCG